MEAKVPMSSISLNGQNIEEINNKKAPTASQEENIRRALRDYYAKK